MKQFRDTNYYVSEDGIIVSRYLVGGDNRFKKGVESKNKERIVGKGKSNGYHVVKPKWNKSGFYVHQMVMECYGQPSPGLGFVIDHIDGDKSNNHISNLQWLSIGDNVRKG